MTAPIIHCVGRRPRTPLRLSACLLLVYLLAVCAVYAQAPKPSAQPAVKPRPAPTRSAPAKPATVKPAATKPAATPATQDLVKGEEYLFKMAAAIIRPGSPLRGLHVESSLTQHHSSMPEGRITAEIAADYGFPDRMRATTRLMGREGIVELRDSSARTIMSGMTTPVPPGPLLEELARHYINLALACKSLKATYLGFETVARQRVLRLTVRHPQYAAGPIELLLDPKTFLPLRVRYRGRDPYTGAQAAFEEELGDWRQVAGVRMAYRRQVRSADRLVTEETISQHKPTF